MSESRSTADEAPRGKALAALSFAALGVIYGDIGTSPLYAVRECFAGEYGIAPAEDSVLGVLSLMFWALVLVVSVKYLVFVLRADNQGEGGVIALAALVGESGVRRRRLLLALGLFAAALLYGDGMITPAISVLSAVEGLRSVTPALEVYIVPLTVVILVLLFLLQRHGTSRIGMLFGPVNLLWFCTLGVLGVRGIAERPQVLLAVNPWYGVRFLASHGLAGVLVLGAVLLVVTGAEALYADMGHFGRRPIRLTWFAFVLPMLLCNYFGQAAWLLAHPGQVENPFYSLAPAWATIPLVILATAATIIASQAVITGAFSLTRQAVQLGYLPRMRIVHTSAETLGQIYVPRVNWLLMVATIALVLGFGSSSHLAAAYGVAVTATMLSTNILFHAVARHRWRWGWLRAGLPVLLFLVIDLAFFGANVGKIAHGAWFPLAIGAAVYLVQTTWKRGRALLSERLYPEEPDVETFLRRLAEDPPVRVPGKAVFLAGRTRGVPPALVHNLQHNHCIHEATALITVITDEDRPRVPREQKVEVIPLTLGFTRVVAHYGFMEAPNVPHILAMAREQGLDCALEELSFFLGRERIMPDRHPVMPVWRERIFSYLSRNAMGATAFFHIPPQQVVELGTQIPL